MRCRLLDLTLALTRAVSIGWLAISTANGQAAADPDWQPGRTPWGDPDLQGVYTFSTTTPLERPAALAGKEAYTEAELAELQEQLAIQVVTDIVAPPPGELGNAYNRFWHSNEKGRLTGRTSLIVDPPDGRIRGAGLGPSRLCRRIRCRQTGGTARRRHEDGVDQSP